MYTKAAYTLLFFCEKSTRPLSPLKGTVIWSFGVLCDVCLKTIEQTIEMLVIGDNMILIWRHHIA